MTLNRTMRWVSVTSMFLVLNSCSSEVGEPTYPVSGTIMQKGKPIEGAIVAFTPTTTGLAASGSTDAAGVYKLTTKTNGDGAVLGKYSVSITKYESPTDSAKPEQVAKSQKPSSGYPAGYSETLSNIASMPSKNLLPPKFANPATSKLEADVTKGPNKFDFNVD